jgi:hypothetical protein
LIPALALVARGQDEPTPYAGPTLGGEPAMLVPVEVGAPSVAPAPLMMPHALPHYYGRGEWPGFGQGRACGCESCLDATWGCCPRRCRAHLHLWDDYCYESARCPQCGFSMDSMVHSLRCGLANRWGSSGGCDSCGCSGDGHADHGPAAVSPVPGDHPAVPPPPSGKDESAVKKPTMPGTKKEKLAPPKDMGPPTPAEPMTKQPMTKAPTLKEPATKESAKEPMGKEPMLKGTPEKDKESKKTRRVVPAPRNASLLDRLLPWSSSGSR